MRRTDYRNKELLSDLYGCYMDFRTLEKTVETIEKEWIEYNEKQEERISKLKEAIEVLKEEYRKETKPEIEGIADYIIKRAQYYFRNQYYEAFEAKGVIEDLYEATGRNVEKDKVLLVIEAESILKRIAFFFTDEAVYCCSWKIESNYLFQREISDIPEYEFKLGYRVVESLYVGEEGMTVCIRPNAIDEEYYRYGAVEELVFRAENISKKELKSSDGRTTGKKKIRFAELFKRFLLDIKEYAELKSTN